MLFAMIILQLIIAHSLLALMEISFFSSSDVICKRGMVGLFQRLGTSWLKLQVSLTVLQILSKTDAPNTNHFYCKSHLTLYFFDYESEQYQGQDLDGDGEEDYAICQPNQGDMAFYSLYAPLLGLLQTHNEEHEEVKSQIFPKRHVSSVYIKIMCLVLCSFSHKISPLSLWYSSYIQ